MSKPTVVVVEPYSSGNMLAPALRLDGFSPCAVTRAGYAAQNAATLRLEDFDEHIVLDGDDIEPLATRLRTLGPVAIVPGTHTGVSLADRLAAVLTPHLANVPCLASARHHKGDMVAAVAARGLPTIKSLCTVRLDEIESWISDQGLSGHDLVIKPPDSAGTDQLRFVRGGRDWRPAAASLLGSADRYGARVDEVLVQEYVTGTEYAIDTFSYEGSHTVNDIARYRKVSAENHMAIYESMEFLPFDKPGHDEIIVYLKRVLDALGIKFGAAHTEIMVTGRGPLLIEVNARLSGGGQPWTCQLATGDNSIDRMIRYLLGDRDIQADYTLEMAVLVIFFAVRSAGPVSGISKLNAIKDLASCFHFRVDVQDGVYVPETADIVDAQHLGIAVLAHSDPGQVHADHLEVRRIAGNAGRPGGFTIDPRLSEKEMGHIGPFGVHSSLNLYVRDLRDPARIPVLRSDDGLRGFDDDSLRDVASLIAGRSRRGAPEVGGVLIAAPPGSATSTIGQALAARVHGTFAAARTSELGGLIAANPDTEHVVLMALHDEIDFGVVADSLGAMNELRRLGRSGADLGFVIGSTISDLSWLVAKGLSCYLRTRPERAHLCVAPWRSDSGIRAGVEWLARDKIDRAVLGSMLCEQHNGLVSFASPGREHALILADTVLCGSDADRRSIRQGSNPVPRDGASMPCCAFSDRCFRDGTTVRDVIKASRIRADVVYANSCMAWRPGHGLVAAEYQLTSAFQRGIAACYIGAVHQMVPDLRLNDLVHTAAGDGVSAGRIGSMLNDFAAATGSELPHFAVLGLPWVTPFPRSRSAASSSPAVTTCEEPPARAGDGQRLRTIGRSIQALREFPLLGFMPPDDFIAIDADIDRLARIVKQACLGAEPHEAADELVSGLSAQIADVELRAVMDFHEFGKMSYSGLNELWESTLQTSARTVDGRCPYCESRLAEVNAQHPAFEQVRRRALVCDICGPVMDLPAAPVIGSVFIDCPAVWRRPGAVDIKVVITPADAVPQEVIAAAAVHISGAANLGIDFPEAQQIPIRPGRATHLTVSAHLGDDAFVHHHHLVRAVLVAQGMVHYGSRPVAVQPREPGHPSSRRTQRT